MPPAQAVSFSQKLEKTLEMIWKLTISADAPPEVVHCDVISLVLKDYAETSRRVSNTSGGASSGEGSSPAGAGVVSGAQQLLRDYLSRCMQCIADRQNSFTAVHVLRSLLQVHSPSASDEVRNTPGRRLQIRVTCAFPEAANACGYASTSKTENAEMCFNASLISYNLFSAWPIA